MIDREVFVFFGVSGAGKSYRVYAENDHKKVYKV